MKENIKLAWRNLWRNKRRTLITSASIFFAVFFAVLMRSFQLGTYSHMIHQSIESYLGYLQIQDPEYYYDPSIDNSFEYNQELIDEIAETEGIKAIVPRITSFSYASFGQQSKGTIITGINPEKEMEASNPKHHLVRYRLSDSAINEIKNKFALSDNILDLLEQFANTSFKSMDAVKQALKLNDKEHSEIIAGIKKYAKFKGEYLSQNDDGVLVSDKLSKFLKINVGDTLVLIGQGFHGASAAGLFPVRGIVKIPSIDLDNKLIYMSLNRAQEYLTMPGMISSLSINLKNPDDMLDVQEELTSKTDAQKYIVKNWEELNPTLKQQIEGDSKSGQIFMAILYIIIFFGIFGTVLMMIAERKREFGVLVAIGMKKSKLSFILTIEMIFIGLVGTISGLLTCTPIIILGYYNPVKLTGSLAKMMEDMGFDPVMPMQWFDNYFYYQAIIVIVMVIIASYIPLKSIRKMKVNESLRA